MLIDILLAIFLIGGFYIGYKKGIIHSVFTIIALFFGLMVAVKFSHPLTQWLHDSFSMNSRILPFICFILLLVGVILIVNILSWILTKLLDTLMLGWINRIAGGLLWCIPAVLIYSSLLWYADQTDVLTKEAIGGSFTYEYVQPAAPVIIDLIAEAIPYFKGTFESLEEMGEGLTDN